jgi:RecA-family ATPase
MTNAREASDAEWTRIRRELEQQANPPWLTKQEPELPPRPLSPIDPRILDGMPVPERQWLVADWIPMSRATSLYGGGGEGKTLLAQMLATARSINKPWLGLPVRPGNSLLFFCEDDIEEMHARQADINAYYGCTFADLGAMRWLPRLGADNSLMTFATGQGSHTGLFDQLMDAAVAHNADLVVVDTLSDVFIGNENDRSQSRAFAQTALGYLARELKGALVSLAHPSLTGSANGSTGSGSTTWKGTFRSQIYLESDKPEKDGQVDLDIRVLRRVKSNYARRDETIEIRWKHGVFVPTQETSGGIIASIEKRSCEHVFLSLLMKTYNTRQYVSHNSRAGNYAPRIFAMQPDCERFRKADFERAMHTLISRKEIFIEQYKDTYGHPHQRLAQKSAP